MKPGEHYSEVVAAALLARLEAGETLSSICKDPAMPIYATVRLWNRDDTKRVADISFADALKRSRQEQMWTWADEIVAICDVKLEGDRKDPSLVQLARLQVDTKKFLMAKIAPQVFGDKMALSGGGEPIVVKIMNYGSNLEVKKDGKLVLDGSGNSGGSDDVDIVDSKQ